MLKMGEAKVIEITNDFKINMFNEIFMLKPDQVVFYLDFNLVSILHSELKVIYGDLRNVGLDEDIVTFSTILNRYDDTNEIAEVTGKREHRLELINKLSNIEDEMSVLIPIISKEERLWLNVYLRVILLEGNKYLGGIIKNDKFYREIEEDLIKNSYKDVLTGLFNRKTCYKHISAIESNAKVYGVYIDLDKFKSINDLYGHQAGDEILTKFGKYLMSHVQEKIIFYRLAGDEFFIQIGDRTEEEVKEILINILKGVSSITYGDNCALSCSIGAVVYDSKSMANVDLITYADNAMYQSKYRGRNCITFISEKGREYIYI